MTQESYKLRHKDRLDIERHVGYMAKWGLAFGTLILLIAVVIYLIMK